MWRVRKTVPTKTAGLAAMTRRGLSSISHAAKKFYKEVSVEAEGDGFEIKLDGRRLRTPGRGELRLPSEALALGIAAEWDAQEDAIVPAAMPLTSLAATALDQVARERDFVVGNLCKYTTTDTACFLASEAEEPQLHQLQVQRFVPLLDWLANERGVRLEAGYGIGHRPASPAALDAVRTLLDSWSHWELAALQSATQECKSFAIAIALLDQHIDAQDAEVASRLEENAQIERWGFVEGAHDYDVTRIRFRLAAAALFADLAREARA